MSRAVPFNPIRPAQATADLAAVLEPDILIKVYVLPGYAVITGMRPAEYNLFELDVHMRSHPFVLIHNTRIIREQRPAVTVFTQALF